MQGPQRMVQTVPVDAADVLAGRYRLVERLGEGGMSVVWRAHDEVLDRQVAVKLLSPRLVADQDSRQRIRAEAQAVAKLAHPNVAGVFDFGEHDDGERVPYIVMELLTGKTLADRLDEGPLPVPDVLRICSQVATALGAAHEHGIVHRDVKPANVMVTASGQAKVVDFGVAAVVGDLADRDAVLFGTPAYVAPERLSGDAVVAATDVYGLGVLLYRMLTGHMPWSADSTTQMLVAHMYVEPDPLPPLTGLPAEVVEVCEACLAKEPDDRPGAAEVAEILAAAAASIGGAAPARRSPIVSKRRQQRRRAFAFAGAAVALVAVVIAAVVAATVVRPDGPAGGVTTADEAGKTAVPGASVGVGGVGGTAKPSNGAPGTTPTRAGGETGAPDDPAASAPGVPPPPTTTSTPPGGGGQNGGPDPVQATQTSYGNTVTVECTGTAAKIVVADPGDTWSITRIQPGPSEQVNVKFVSTTAEPFQVTFRGRCNGGTPRINLSND